jgi:hypothetical protein
MTETLDGLRKNVVRQVRQQRQIAEQKASLSPAKLLGGLIEASLSHLNLSREQFARELDIEPALADALLAGFLPASEIDDDFLVDIATVIGHEPNTLRIVLGRGIAPTVDPDDAPYGEDAAEV